MKICLITRFLYPQKTGGAEIFSNMLALSLVEKGHEVHLICQRTASFPMEEDFWGVHIHRVRYPLFFGLEVYPLGAVAFFVQALLVIHRIQPDIIHAFQTSFCGSHGIFLAKLLRVPIIINDRGSFFTLPEWYRTKLAPFILKRANFVVVSSVALKESMERIIDRKRQVGLVQTGVIMKNYNRYSKEEAKQILGWDRDERNIIFVGRFHEDKGPLYLVKAMKELRERNEGKYRLPVLRMLGDGGQREELETLIGEHGLQKLVKLEGKVPKNMIPLYFDACELVVIPSTSDSFPNVALEALASGKPMVGSRVGGIPEILEERVNALLAAPRDHEGLAGHILTLLRDKELYRKMSAANRERASRFSWEKMLGDFERMYREAMERKTGLRPVTEAKNPVETTEKRKISGLQNRKSK